MTEKLKVLLRNIAYEEMLMADSKSAASLIQHIDWRVQAAEQIAEAILRNFEVIPRPGVESAVKGESRSRRKGTAATRA